MRRAKRTISPKRYNPKLPASAADAKGFRGASDMPAASVSVPGGSMLVCETGSWRNVRPVFEDKTPPCLPRCPAGENIEGHLDLLARGRDAEAARLLREDNPFPATCGRVCYHPCESGCNRAEWGGAVAIHSVERYLGDLALRLPAEKPAARAGKSGRKHRRVAIIGAGPAGLTCAWHLAKRGIEAVVFDREPEPGGVLRTGIPAYRLPKDVLAMEISRIVEAGVELRLGVEVGRDIAFEDLRSAYRAVFLACGYHRPRALGVPGESLKGVEDGLDFLRRINYGQKVTPGRRSVVIGGGNTAMDCARAALRLGSHPLVIYRRTRGEMPAIPEEVLEAEREGVEFLFLMQPAEVRGKGGRVAAVRCQRCRLGEPDASGRRRPVPIKDSFQDLAADTVLLATGEDADLSFLPSGWTLGDNGAVLDPATGHEVEGVFAGGDLTTSRKMVANAVGSGKAASWVIEKYLSGRSWSESLAELEHAPTSFSVARLEKAGAPPRSSEIVDATSINFDHFPKLSRASAGRLSSEEAIRSFAEVNQGFDRATAEAEARRCFHCAVCSRCDNCFVFCPEGIVRHKPGKACGDYEIDLSYCKGCGICAAECPRGAISMIRENR
ncbi:MAG TPA: NAD(P)-binding protein [Planctomycetota bacterium]|nr:NAD(P)-binding protein [Planctomycetota bacterium]